MIGMKAKSAVFLLCLGAVSPSFADSLLSAQSFPQTFQDLSFTSRLEILRESYMPYRIEYDANGVCISGCAYTGITIKDDMDAVDKATEDMENLIKKSKSESSSALQPVRVAKNWCENGQSTKLPLRYPVDMSNLKYYISSDFGFRTNSPNGARFHPAVDIGCPVGTPVYATADGVVVTVANETKPGGAGKYVNIKHENGLITQYLHLNEILVKKGDAVSACQQIATSGNSGTSVGGAPYAAHLDYRIRFNSDQNNYVDILCPCKVSNRTNQNSFDNTVDISCAHSLFNSEYTFKTSGTKHSKWRHEHGHCMPNMTSVLPDEVSK